MHAAKRPVSKATYVASIATYVALPLALVLGSLLVGGSSYSAFSSTVSNSSNFGAGKVALSGDATTVASNASVEPGSVNHSVAQNCVNITNSSTIPSTVAFYGKTGSSSTLNQYLSLTVDQGSGATGGTSASCSGFTATKAVYNSSLPAFLSTYTGFSNGLSVTLDPGQSASFRLNVTSGDMPNTAQGLSSQWAVLWEAQNS